MKSCVSVSKSVCICMCWVVSMFICLYLCMYLCVCACIYNIYLFFVYAIDLYLTALTLVDLNFFCFGNSSYFDLNLTF